jgi:hypothetical protein
LLLKSLHLIHLVLELQSLLFRRDAIVAIALATHDCILDRLCLKQQQLSVLLMLHLSEGHVFCGRGHGNVGKRSIIALIPIGRELGVLRELAPNRCGLGKVVIRAVGDGSWAAGAKTSEERGAMSRHGQKRRVDYSESESESEERTMIEM